MPYGTNETTGGNLTNAAREWLVRRGGFNHFDLEEGEFEAAPLEPEAPQQVDRNDFDQMVGAVRRYMAGERGVLSVYEVRNFLRKKSKRKHLTQSERRFLHAPPNDGDKVMSSLEIDDLLPVE